MTLGIIGLGTMGAAISRRISTEHTVYGYDPYAEEKDLGEGQQVATIDEVLEATRTILILVPAGDPVDDVIDHLCEHSSHHLTIMDGGNSHFQDSLERRGYVQEYGHTFIDVGISGGERGEKHGYAVMAGGQSSEVESISSILKAIATEDGYGHVGPPGAGHYVKMIHNGIEYALLQAYAEGFHLLRQGRYPELDLEQVSRIWSHGAIVDSFLLRLIHDIMQKNQALEGVSGCVQEGGTGEWTVEEAFEQGIAVHAIAQALNLRFDSQKSGGTYATKLIARLRHSFGGHRIYCKEDTHDGEDH